MTLKRLCSVAPFLLLMAASPEAAEVSLALDIEASSEPVPIDEMINGWGTSAQSGDYAYADGVAKIEAEYSGFYLSAERRYYYLYEFSPETVSWYLDVENGVDSSSERDIELRVKSFDARGLSAGYRFRSDSWSFLPVFTIYRLGHYQLGTLDGRSSEGEGINASAFLNYWFDEDKILEYDRPEGDRFGYSLSLSGEWQISQNWRSRLNVRDLWNRLDFLEASHRTGCINVGSVAESVCEENGASVSGKDELADYQTSIDPTVNAAVTYAPYALTSELYWHGPYQRLSVFRDWEIGHVSVGTGVTSLNQLAVRVSGEWFALSYMADNLNYSNTRDLSLSARLFLRW